MIEIGLHNFQDYLPKVLEAIQKSSFISIDVEFFGFPYARHSDSADLMDSSDIRYSKFRAWVQQYPPCQIGVSCFRENDSKLEVDSFGFSVFKRVLHSMSMSSQAAEFLEEHQFDFNNLIKDGVHFLNEREFKTFKEEFQAATFFREFVDIGISMKMEKLKCSIMSKLKIYDTYSENQTLQPTDDFLIELELQEVVASWVMNNYEAMIVIKSLERSFKNLVFKLSTDNELLFIRPRKSREPDDLSYFYGFSEIFRAIAKWQKPLVGHNCYMDLLHIYQSFIDDLPESYPVFKQKFTTHFPYVYDTKFIGFEYLKLHRKQILLSSLSDFVDFAEKSFPLLWHSLPCLQNTMNPSDSREHYHEAAYDAFVTGKIFVVLARAYKRNLSASTSFEILLNSLRRRISNRIPLALINYQYCFLDGEDPVGQRPKPIRICRKRNVISSSHPWLSKFVIFTLNWLLGPPEIKSNRLNTLNCLLMEVFGWHRLSLKLEEDESTLIIACGTSPIHDRIMCFINEHPEYELVEEGMKKAARSIYDWCN